MLQGLSEDLVELVPDKLEERIPHWFDRTDADFLIVALIGRELDDEVDAIASDVEDKICPEVMTMVDSIFCGKRIGTIGEVDIVDKAKKTLRKALIDLHNEDAEHEYERVESDIKEAAANLRKLKVKLKALRKPQ